MGINKIRLTNFKSFRRLDAELGSLNIMIGVNAAGKSNFIQSFQFLRDIALTGAENAVSMQGGAEYIRNLNMRGGTELGVHVSAGVGGGFFCPTSSRPIYIEFDALEYEFVLRFQARGTKFTVVHDECRYKCRYREAEDGSGPLPKQHAANGIERGQGVLSSAGAKPGEVLGTGMIRVTHRRSSIGVEVKKPAGVPITEKDLLLSFSRAERPKPESLLLENKILLMLPAQNLFSNISIYDIDPKTPKQAAPVTGRADLEENGANLAIVLKGILEDREKKRKFANVVRDLLPHVEDLDVRRLADTLMFFSMRETYSRKKYLPATLLSDGTVNLIALVVALYFERKGIIIVEEPERNIHPFLMSKVVDMMRDTALNMGKQIIVTTHNPEFVKHAGLEDLLLVSRDDKGFSRISRPGRLKEVKSFLKTEMGIDELYVQNLLEI